MVVIVVSGLPGAGKEVFLKTMEHKGFSTIRMGDVVREYARRSGLGSDDSSIGTFANSERGREGTDIWARRTLEEMPGGDMIIDGCRSLEELGYFQENLDNIITVGITAPEENRFERLRNRGRADDPNSFEDFKKREAREIGWGLLDAVMSAKIILKNDSSLEEFRQLCENTLDAVREGGPKKP